ncbi:phosphate ABC transporter permease subunit PstC [Neogemmobacter tilapiae]|uniref:Phosphate transport system permease protein n=1 Tax=Neogemmobacter tilapiae TaxID=875041 RepID=A0A918TD73_9RHOB|nr:phosphate ABC transporter permease subunit PstC [Gemmobacter tilapiae]GHC43154.1 phosphate transport system permease protein [Gemmobacter tilapiae]
MSVFMTLVVLLIIAATAFVLCRQRALAMVAGDARKLHSLPGFHGWHGVVMALVPSILMLAVWLIAQPMVVERQVFAHMPTEMTADASAAQLVMADVRRLAQGLETAVETGRLGAEQATSPTLDPVTLRGVLAEVGVALGSEVTAPILNGAQEYRSLQSNFALWRTIVILAVAALGVAWAVRLTQPDFWARNRVEKVVLGLLILASTIAILTTFGIVYSMLTETIHFFQQYPIADFFFGLTWSPNFKGGSELGVLPLIWGTLYISLVAMVVAVPIGLFAAIYLSEYATPKVRAWVKPLIEVIAGIPTVVFGLFALVTVGPLLRDWFAEPMGLGNSGSSVMTAGIVIGIMNIPFISSLSDDIINAVPQAMRDGSLGLGATKSETVRQVVLPAALPGIVGAVLMAASRAIGETMIVTLGAGAAAKLSLNPFEAMTTMTVKIVGQLTGDTDFASPETLVAFALGMTLFVITLCLNVLALIIVRRYREQYE